MDSVYIFGHKKPDTDTVTSAIALSYLKNKLNIKCKPMVLGNINNETKFVLDYFNIEVPELLEDVKLQIKDLNYYKDCYINENDSINSLHKYMLKNNITGVPIVDDDKKIKGLLTSKIICSYIMDNFDSKLYTSYENILNTLKGIEVLKYDTEIIGNISVDNIIENSILIIDNIEKLDTELKLIICNNYSDEVLEYAKENNINIIKTTMDKISICNIISSSNYVKILLKDSRNIYFNENDYYDEFKKTCLKLGHNNYPVINNKKECLGLIRITDLNNIRKKKVILVDHNEINQSVDGIEEAQILEIIDHHKIGSLNTSMPINFRNMTVGSTNTIVYSMFVENNVSIPQDIAGIMLSGLLSDTLKFTSPTTTEYDKFVARKLALIANIDIDKYSYEMFKKGTNLEGKTIKQILTGDLKTFDINNKKIAISQLITMNSDNVLKEKEEYIRIINEIKNDKEYDNFIFCITDILKSGSCILFDDESINLIKEMFNIDDIYEGYFFDKCLSRKKQLVPLLMDSVR